MKTGNKIKNNFIKQRLDRCKGILLGCAVGDALGITQETFVMRPNHLEHTLREVLKQRQVRKEQGFQTTYEGGGPWEDLQLSPGEWTDDTAMMLCLCDSLLASKTLNINDLVIKFRNWWYRGYNACRRGMSIGLGANTQQALERFDSQYPDRLTGGTNPQTDAGNGALMRLGPIPVYWHQELEMAISMARRQCQTTHNVEEATDACAVMTFILWHAINGKSKQDILASLQLLEADIRSPKIKELMQPDAAWRVKAEEEVITLPSRCLWTLEAVLWCILKTDSFEDALIKAINLGGDADTVGAITGQIAGALYGIKSIPVEWLTILKHRDKIEMRAIALYRRDSFGRSFFLFDDIL